MLKSQTINTLSDNDIPRQTCSEIPQQEKSNTHYTQRFPWTWAHNRVHSVSWPSCSCYFYWATVCKFPWADCCTNNRPISMQWYNNNKIKSISPNIVVPTHSLYIILPQQLGHIFPVGPFFWSVSLIHGLNAAQGKYLIKSSIFFFTTKAQHTVKHKILMIFRMIFIHRNAKWGL